MTDRKKKIAFFYPVFLYGGAERVIVNLATQLTKFGFNVSIITINEESDFLDKNLPPTIEVIYLNTPRKYRLIRSFLPLVRYLKNNHFDIVFTSWWYLDLIVVLAIKITSFLKNRRTKIVYILHGPTTNINLIQNIWERMIVKISIYFTLRLVAKIVIVSRGAAKDFSQMFKIPIDKFQIIYNPIVSKDLIIKSQESINETWFNQLRRPIIIAVGRLSKEKNFTLLLEAFSIILKKKQANLLILGEGEEKFELEDFAKKLKISDYLCMPGAVVNPYKFMKNSDILVLSSIYEGLPTVLIEALACGIPVVSTDCPYGPREILDNGKFGKLVPMNDPQALAEAIIETLNNPISTDILKERAQVFSVDNAVNQYLKLIEEL